MTDLDPPTPTMTQCAMALKRAMEEISKLRARKEVNRALNEQNKPLVTSIHDTSLNSPVLVWREGHTGHNENWTNLFTLIGISRETCQVLLPSGPTDFRSTVVKPYHTNETKDNNEEEDNEIPTPDEPYRRNL